MLQKVKKYIQSSCMIENGDGIVVGVSGGVDSVALLLVLQEMKKEWDLQLYAVHINHGIRPEASGDAEYVKSLCGQLTVPFYLFEADIPAMAQEQGATEEEMGRIYRYQCFRSVMEQVGAKKIAVAHHMDDQAETLLFHLARGSRLAGVEGMHPMTANGIIRPLLVCRKTELVDWLTERSVSWKEDVTNTDNAYARNKIRNRVLPVLEEVNARAVVHMTEFAEEMAAYRTYFQKAVDIYVGDHVCFKKNGELECDRNHLLQQELILIKAVIYEMLTAVSGQKKDIGNVHVQAVYELLLKQSGRKLSLPYGVKAEISYEKLIIRKSLEETDNVMEKICLYEVAFFPLACAKDGGCEFELPGMGILHVSVFERNNCLQKDWNVLVEEARNSKNNYTKYFECDTIKDTLCIRFPRQEDYLIISEMGSRKKLSRYFIDEKIPAGQRNHIFVLAEKENVLWVLGKRRCEKYKVTAQSNIIMKVTYKGE